MKYLLDTHVLLWIESNPEQLSQKVSSIIQDFDNTLFLSLATVWEVQIKVQIGKLKLQNPLSQVVRNQLQNNHVELLTIRLDHLFEMDNLPLHHRDPFDRLLIAQARVEGLTLLSIDAIFAKYPVSVIW